MISLNNGSCPHFIHYDTWSERPEAHTNISMDNWYLLTGTFDGSILKMYLDGNLIATTTGSSVDTPTGTGYMGVQNNGSGNSWTGYLDDVAVFNRALTAQEVDNLYTGDWTSVASSGTIQSLSYVYDNNNNITQILNASGNNANSTIEYTYDDLSRLTNASTTAATTTPYNYSYSYDRIGNILSRTENGTSTNYTYATGTAAYLNPNAALAVGNATSTYDNNGNLTAIVTNNATSSAYTWDYNNRMTQASSTGVSVTYAYDPSGQRVKQTQGATTTIYSTKFYNTNGTNPTKNIFLPDGTLIATIVGTGATTTVSYIHTDHLGGMNVATNDNAEVVEVSDYYPYGSARIDEQSGFSSQRKFANYEFDPASNLNYLNQRYYNGTDARFLSQDPVFLKLGDKPIKTLNDYLELRLLLSDPQQLNSYSYAKNNPLINTDPNGEWALAIPFIGGGSLSLSGLGALILSGAEVIIPIGILVYPRTANAPEITDEERNIISNSTAQALPGRGLAPDGILPPVADPGKLKVGPASRPTEVEKGGESYWDPDGGEWRYAPGDKYHNPHWDYNPHQPGQPPGSDGKQGDEWRNVPIGDQPPVKSSAPTKSSGQNNQPANNSKPKKP